MANVTIERLSLQLSGVSEGEGERLGRLISEGLASEYIPGNPIFLVGDVKVSAAPKPGETMDRLSQQIVTDLLRQLKHSV